MTEQKNDLAKAGDKANQIWGDLVPVIGFVLIYNALRIINPGFVRSRLTAKNSFRMPGLMDPVAAARRIVAEAGAPGTWLWGGETTVVVRGPGLVHRLGRTAGYSQHRARHHP